MSYHHHALPLACDIVVSVPSAAAVCYLPYTVIACARLPGQRLRVGKLRCVQNFEGLVADFVAAKGTRRQLLEVDRALAVAFTMANNTASMISASNWCMRAWEMGNEAEYRAVTTANFRMVRQCLHVPCVVAGLRLRRVSCAHYSPLTL